MPALRLLDLAPGRVDVLTGPLRYEKTDDQYACGGCGAVLVSGLNVSAFMGRFAITCPCGAVNETAVDRQPDRN